MIEGKIQGGKNTYVGTNLEQLSVAVNRRSATGLPFKDGRRVEVFLTILNHRYQAGLRANLNMRYVWISPNVKDAKKKRTNLATIFDNLGWKKNDDVLLRVKGIEITLARRQRTDSAAGL